MAAPPKIAQLRETDLGLGSGEVTGAGVQEAFRRVFTALNPYFDALNKLVSKRITLTDNIQCDVVSGSFSHGVTQSVLLKTLVRANGIVVLGCDSQRSAGCSIQMTQPSALGPTALVTLWFADPTAKNVTCSLLLLPEGQQSSSTPA